MFSQQSSRFHYIQTKPLPFKRRWWGFAQFLRENPCSSCRTAFQSFPELSEVGTALAFGVFLSASSAAAVAAAEAGAAGAEVGALKSATRESLY